MLLSYKHPSIQTDIYISKIIFLSVDYLSQTYFSRMHKGLSNSDCADGNQNTYQTTVFLHANPKYDISLNCNFQRDLSIGVNMGYLENGYTNSNNGGSVNSQDSLWQMKAAANSPPGMPTQMIDRQSNYG